MVLLFTVRLPASYWAVTIYKCILLALVKDIKRLGKVLQDKGGSGGTGHVCANEAAMEAGTPAGTREEGAGSKRQSQEIPTAAGASRKGPLGE